MKLYLFRFLFTMFLVLAAFSSVAAFGPGQPDGTQAGFEEDEVAMQDLTISLKVPDSGKVMEVPLFSEKYASTPVAMVNGEAITLEMLVNELARAHQESDSSEGQTKDFSEAVDRLITIKLVKQEALNIGFDRTPAFQRQVDNFYLKTLLTHLFSEQLKDLEIDSAKADELYQNMAIEVKLSTYSFDNKKDAEALEKAFLEGGEFESLIKEQVKLGKAEGGQDEGYVKLVDLIPSVAEAVYRMEVGEVSQVFKGQNNYLIFHLKDRRVYEDANVRTEAASINFRRQALSAQKDYIKALEEKYVQINDEADEEFDFQKIIEANPQMTGTEIFGQLIEDERPYAIITFPDQTVIISVADIAKKMKSKMFHGVNRTLDPEDMEKQKNNIITDEIIAVTGKLEAERLNLDKTPEFLGEVEKYKERLLFDTFMQKAVIPEVRVPEDEAKAYYSSHLEEYSSPLMLKMKSLVFTKRESAEDALKKLRSGSDFKWVSSNAVDLADPDKQGILGFDKSLLASTALPVELQKQVTQVQPGDALLFSGPQGLFYTLVIEEIHPSVAKPYTEVRQEVGRIIYEQKIKEALDDWVEKLKEVYETENYLSLN